MVPKNSEPAPTPEPKDEVESSPTSDSSALTPSASSAAGNESKSQTRSPASLAEFIDYAYARNGRRLTLREQDALAIAVASVDGDFWDRLPGLAQQDTLLAVPKEILLAAIPRRRNIEAWQRLHRVCAIALESHQVSSMLMSEVAGDNRTIEDLKSVLRQASRMKMPTPAKPDSARPMSKAKAATLRTNVLYTLALWAFTRHEINSTEMIHILYECIWKSEAQHVKSITDIWRNLPDLKESACIGLVGDVFFAEAEALRSEAAHVRQLAEAAQSRVKELTLGVATLEDQLEEERRRTSGLTQELDLARGEHETAVSHLRDEFERLRSRVLRRLLRELELLEEGMLALRRDPPRTQVMEDHGDRAITGIREEVKALQSETIE